MYHIISYQIIPYSRYAYCIISYASYVGLMSCPRLWKPLDEAAFFLRATARPPRPWRSERSCVASEIGQKDLEERP